MQVPETPATVIELDLMKRLDDYATGNASWNDAPVGAEVKAACRTLHTNLSNLVNGMLAYILDRVTAREMETFTMHDRVHGRKVAHLMWHIFKPERQQRLTPPEIGILVVAAHLHDLGMGLSPAERAERLAPQSDLWDRLEIDENTKTKIEQLRAHIGGENLHERKKLLAEQQLFQAEEALLTQDTRERHATKERYERILELLADFHTKDPTKIPNINSVLSFDGDSFRDKLIDVCASHNEDADALVANDETNLDRPRFPKDFPVGRCNADLQTVAAALRLADILDFDRERTPAVLFHYLLPNAWDGDNRSILEWNKHLAVSNWHIERDDIVFRGRSQNHIIHHAVVQFCNVISEEIKATHATFSALAEQYWPFNLPLSVKADIHEEGYRYVPYKFELDDARVYSLLMGGAIYDDPLVAVRELVQNAVDACKLRDSLTRLYEEYEEPNTHNRIFIRYEEPNEGSLVPKLTVTDTGTGMDAYTLERYFLKVGRSYYSSSDFNQFRVQLRKKHLDFAPVSEFGIGFLSTFLLADHVEVETAMWEPLRGDTIKRTLKIDGPTRLIRLDENRNEGAGRFKGTRIILFLSPKISEHGRMVPVSWKRVVDYLRDVCQDLPYRLNLEHIEANTSKKDVIDPSPLVVAAHPQLEPALLRIPIRDETFGIEGEIALIDNHKLKQTGEFGKSYFISSDTDDKTEFLENTVLRGGFKIGRLEFLPKRYSGFVYLGAGARLRLTWNQRNNKRYLTPNIARNDLPNTMELENTILRLWLGYVLQNINRSSAGHFLDLNTYLQLFDLKWLETYDALTIYNFAREDWLLQLRRKKISAQHLKDWEKGHGKPLWYDFDSVGHSLLELLLPRVTNIQLDKNGHHHVRVPQEDWISLLDGWRNYVTSPVEWGQFAEYLKGIDTMLLFSYWGEDEGAQRLNSKYKELFAGWTQDEISKLIQALTQLTDVDKNRVVLVNQVTLDIVSRSVEIAGDLEIGSRLRRIKLKDLKLAEFQ